MVTLIVSCLFQRKHKNSEQKILSTIVVPNAFRTQHRLTHSRAQTMFLLLFFSSFFNFISLYVSEFRYIRCDVAREVFTDPLHI